MPALSNYPHGHKTTHGSTHNSLYESFIKCCQRLQRILIWFLRVLSTLTLRNVLLYHQQALSPLKYTYRYEYNLSESIVEYFQRVFMSLPYSRCRDLVKLSPSSGNYLWKYSQYSFKNFIECFQRVFMRTFPYSPCRNLVKLPPVKKYPCQYSQEPLRKPYQMVPKGFEVFPTFTLQTTRLIKCPCQY